MSVNNISPQFMAQILLACITGEANEEQQKLLEEWLEESAANRDFYEHLSKIDYRNNRLKEFLRYNPERDWQQVKNGIYWKKRSIFRRWYPYAALLLLGLAIWGIFHIDISDDPAISFAQEEIFPGSAKACLILPDGSRIALNARQDTIRKGNFVNSGHTLAYADSGCIKKAQQHVLQIPRGGEYKLVLSDGTRVWLNAETELRYPDYFVGDSREVVLRGEAYFEVVKDAEHPFYVRTAEMLVRVTGTAFNVRAYQNEYTQATLVDGSVDVECKAQNFLMKPGEQVTLTGEKAVVCKVNNLRNYVGWIESRFVFEDKPLEDVLRDLERWYDVRIFIQNEKIRQLTFTGNLPKFENMGKVLDVISLATCVDFEVNGRTILVKAQN